MNRSAADFNLPDVDRDFVISPSSPPELQDFVVELLWYLYSEEGGGKIDEYGMWDMGHCWVLAQALHEWMGPRSYLKWIVAEDLHKDLHRILPQHVIVKVGEFYIDGNGLFTRQEIADWFKRQDFAHISMRTFDPVEAGRCSIHCEPWKRRQLIRDFEKEFGDGREILELAFLPR